MIFVCSEAVMGCISPSTSLVLRTLLVVLMRLLGKLSGAGGAEAWSTAILALML